MIRLFNLDDLDNIMKIWLDSNLEVHNYIDKNYFISNYEYAKEEMKKSNIFVYEEDRKIYGFIGIADRFIQGIFVSKDSRSKGIGKKLIDYCKEKFDTLTLSVYKKNERAIVFYKRQGFQIQSKSVDSQTKEIEYVMIWKRWYLTKM